MWYIPWQVILRVCECLPMEVGGRSRRRSHYKKNKPEAWGTARHCGLLVFFHTSVICFPRCNIVFLLLERVIYPNAYLDPSWCTNPYLLLYLCRLNFSPINKKCRFGDIQCFHENVLIFFLFLSGLLSGSKSRETQVSLKRCKSLTSPFKTTNSLDSSPPDCCFVAMVITSPFKPL